MNCGSLVEYLKAFDVTLRVLQTAESLTRAAYELALGLDARLTADDEKFFASHEPRAMASDESYATLLDADARKALIDDDDDSPIGELMDVIADAYAMVAPSANAALVDANLMDAKRVAASSSSAAVAMYPQIVKLLGGPATLLYTAPGSEKTEALLISHPPVVVLPSGLISERAESRSEIQLDRDAALRFALGRTAEWSRPRRIFATDPESFKRMIAGLQHTFGPPADRSANREIAATGERLRSKLSVAQRKAMTERLAAAGRLDPDAYIAACHRAGTRAGLIACCNATWAMRLSRTDEGKSAVAKLAASPKYLAIRRALRGSGVEVDTNPFQRGL